MEYNATSATFGEVTGYRDPALCSSLVKFTF